MKKLILICCLLLTACNVTPDKTGDVTNKANLPKELEDCKAYQLITEAGIPNLYVIKCPNSTTTTTYQKQTGKIIENISTTITVNGVEYVRK